MSCEYLIAERLNYCLQRQSAEAKRKDWVQYEYWRSAIKHLHELLDDIERLKKVSQHYENERPAQEGGVES